MVVTGCDAIRVHAPTAQTRIAHVRLLEADGRGCVGSGVLATPDGQVVAEIEGVRIANVTSPEVRYASRLSHVAWAPDAPPERVGAGGADERWLVLAEGEDPWAVQLAAALSDRVGGCRLVSAGNGAADPASDLRTVLADDDGQPVTGVAFAVSGNGDDGQPQLAARARVARAIAAIRTLALLPRPPRLWFVTRDDGRRPLAGAGLSGLARVAAYEHAALAPSTIAVDEATAIEHVVEELLDADTPIAEVAWRAGERSTARMRGVPPGPPPDGEAERPPVRPGAGYVVSGGLGGLGLATARWLAEQGAGRVVLVGRSAPSPEAEQALAAIRDAGAEVTLVRGDVADPEVAERAVATASDGRELRGVIGASGVIADATLANVEPEMLDRVWRSKADAAWALHTATLGHELDFWVLYSSMASSHGSPGQATHATANDFLDQLVAWRAAEGLPATGINWGGWSEIGSGQGLAERGFEMIAPEEGIDALARILTAGYTRVGYSPIDLERWLAPFPALARATLFSELLGDAGSVDDEAAILDALLAADSDDGRRELMEAHIIACVHEILGGGDRHITPTTSLVMLGLDSLAAVHLQHLLEHSFKIVIEPGVIWVKPTAAGLADWIMKRMALTAVPTSA